MKQETAQNIIQLLDRVQLNGHKERMVMNECVEALVPFLQDQLRKQVENGEADTD